MQFINMTVASLAVLATLTSAAAPLQPLGTCAVACHAQYHQGRPYRPSLHQAAQDRYDTCMSACRNNVTPQAPTRRHTGMTEPCTVGTACYTQKMIDASMAKLTAKLNATGLHNTHPGAAKPAPAPQPTTSTTTAPDSTEPCTVGTECYTQKMIDADIAKSMAELNNNTSDC